MRVVASLAAVAPVLTIAAQDDVLVERSVTEKTYARMMSAGNLQPERAWEGYKIFRRTDGSCYRVSHSNLRIENDQGSQSARFEELITDDVCPHARVLTPQSTSK